MFHVFLLWMEAACSTSAATLVGSGLLSVGAYLLVYNMTPRLSPLLTNAHVSGVDMNKQDRPTIPEATGVIGGSIYLLMLFLFIPFPFRQQLVGQNARFPHEQFVEMISAMLTICFMMNLGFVDDVLGLRWRHKLLLSSVASLPLLMVYYVTYDLTTIIIPKPFRPWLGFDVDLGFVYYIYMGMVVVFCTNAINILAGINGLEVGQTVVLAASVIIFNFIELTGECSQAHQFSLYFMLPLLGISIALLRHNWYPAKVFVGDTFCYFAGITFAVVGISGHFSKTMLLFFVPQIFNFLYSVPQLFHFVPCPRHRMPNYDAESDKLKMSFFTYKKGKLPLPGSVLLKFFSLCGLTHQEERAVEDDIYVECSNLTLINLTLKFLGRMHERNLTLVLMMLQMLCSIMAFFIRYQLVKLFYDV